MTRHISARTAELLAEITAARAESEQFPAYSDEYQSCSETIVDAAMALMALREGEDWRIECPRCDFVMTPRDTVGEAVEALREHERTTHPSITPQAPPAGPAPAPVVIFMERPMVPDMMAQQVAAAARRSSWVR